MLRQLNLVAGIRRGKEIHYGLTDEHLVEIYRLTAQHVAERAQ